MKLKRYVCLAMAILTLLAATACGGTQPVQQNASSAASSAVSSAAAVSKPTAADVSSLVSKMTLEQKAAQMMQGAVYSITDDQMKSNCYGSVLSTGGGFSNTAAGWKSRILDYQKAAMASPFPIPFLYGNDAVHGHNTVYGTVIFPHNIGIGAANDPDLTYKMGEAVAEEMKLTGVLWNFAPVVAVAEDPRWGRTYESYSTNVDIVTSLSTAFAKGQLAHGVMPTAKHFIGDGTVVYGTGEEGKLIDRGDAKLSDAKLNELLKPYISLMNAGVKTIMASHSSVNGIKMHQSKELLTDKLKGELKFDGFLVSDWESIEHIEGANLTEKVIAAVNAGIDMLMQPTNYSDCAAIIVQAVKDGKIPQSRVDDAVSRILKVKIEMGLFDDPMQEKITAAIKELGSADYRSLARQLVEKSLVLVKNQNNVLPLKKGAKVYVVGPTANNVGVQCGGWTVDWAGKEDANGQRITQGTTILEGLKAIAKDYNLTLITDPSEAKNADVTLLCLGEKPYAEWEGDTEDLSIVGKLALGGNKAAIETAKQLGKPTATLVVAGREVLLGDYLNSWDSVVMCYLPGSEGEGVANVLAGKTGFSGKLSMPWYKTTKGIGTEDVLFKQGYGLTY